VAAAGLADATVRKIVTCLKAILKRARAKEWMHHNPVEDLRVEADKRNKRKIKAGVDFPLQSEVAAIIGAATGLARPFILVATFAGLRASELRGLRWQDVDFAKATITISQRADRFNQIGNPKSEGSARTIPVPPMVINALREWKLSHGVHELV